MHYDIHVLKSCVVFVELKQLEVQPVPENLTVLDLSWYKDYEYFTVLFIMLKSRTCACSKPGADSLCFPEGTS